MAVRFSSAAVLTGLSMSLLLTPAGVWAQRTTQLLQDDLQQNHRTKIDGDSDDSLDAAMGGGGGFSTKTIDQVEDRLRAELTRNHPRAIPRLVIFLYPGRIDMEALRGLQEVDVDVQVVMDPCERSVCREAVAKHIEMVGRAIGKSVYPSPSYKLVWKTLQLTTSTQLHDTEVLSYSVPIADCIAAAGRPGGGMAWLDGQKHAVDDYVPLMTKAVSQREQSRRVSLIGPPNVQRSASSVAVTLKVKGDRVRGQQQVVDAFSGAAEALRASKATPASGQLEVDLDSVMRGSTSRKFRTAAQPVGQLLDGQIDSGRFWSSYVIEVKEGKEAGQNMTFDDAEASGHPAASGGGDSPPDDNEVVGIIRDNFSSLSSCARAELGRNARFRGVVLTFRWSPSGGADQIQPKEAALKNGPLAKCLADAVKQLPLPRFSGAPRTIEYPIQVK